MYIFPFLFFLTVVATGYGVMKIENKKERKYRFYRKIQGASGILFYVCLIAAIGTGYALKLNKPNFSVGNIFLVCAVWPLFLGACYFVCKHFAGKYFQEYMDK